MYWKIVLAALFCISKLFYSYPYTLKNNIPRFKEEIISRINVNNFSIYKLYNNTYF